MDFVSLRKFLEMEPGESRPADAATAVVEAEVMPKRPVAATGRPECEPACAAWIERFDSLFPAQPEDATTVAVCHLAAPPGEWQAPKERRQRMMASLELASIRRAAERESLRRQSDEVRNLVATFNEAVLTLASGGEEVAGRFRRVEVSLVRAARMDDLASVRGCLRDTIELMRREAQAQEAETAARVAGFEAELSRVRTALEPTVASEAADRDQACQLIRSELAGAAAAKFAATVIVFDRLAAARARFGPAVVVDALSAFGRTIAADAAAGGTIYRWNERSMFWKARPGLEPAELRTAMEGLLGKPIDYRTVAGGRPVVLSLLGRWLCAFPGEGGAEALIEEIDQFTGLFSGRR